MRARIPCCLPVAIALACVLLGGRPAAAFEFLDGRLQVHGYGEVQLRMISDGFRDDRWYFSQWANLLAIEAELDIAPEGWGPFDSLGAFLRAEVRFDCIWSQACGLSRTTKLFGNRANRAPPNLANGVTSGKTGIAANPFDPPRRVQNENNNLVEFFRLPPLDSLADLGARNLEGTFRPVLDALVTAKRFAGSQAPAIFPLGPWLPKQEIVPNGALRSVPNTTGPRPPLQQLPFRPAVPNQDLGLGQANGIYVPSQALRARLDGFDSFDQNFSQAELQWNRGASQQQTKELKEFYLDMDTLDGRLFIRLGRQSIVWGKTELFRTTDQFNPQDLALSSLPTLEESRIPLWALRAIYSLYDVGPLQDVRLELAVNIDEFEPIDLGKCGEPYTIFLVCAKSFGLFGHGITGAGIAGENRPPSFYESTQGVEIGARIEWRWERFSFALTDFWGYSDSPVVDYFNEYERRVDPATGRPLDVNGDPLVPENALTLHPGNRQAYDVFCSATVGIAGNLLPALENACLLDLLNANVPLLPPALNVTPANALGPALAGNATGSFVLGVLTSLPFPASYQLVELNRDPMDGLSTNPFGATQGLSAYLTDQQEALLGCGPFYQTDCDQQGVDLFNAEASVLVQALPQFEPGGPVATRFVDGRVVQLPGSRGPGDPGYSPLVDGCTGATDLAGNALADCLASNGGAGANLLLNPLTGGRFQNEMAALSYNFLIVLYALGGLQEEASECFTPSPLGPGMVPSADAIVRCRFVSAILAVAGTQRPEMRAGGNGRFGRRDFLWSSGSELRLFYPKRNVLGFSMDFAEDVSKTNWSMEFTWFANDAFQNTRQERGWSRMDALNLTVSVDRPTFVSFLNASRTIFMNAQAFVRYLPQWEGNGTFNVQGPWSFLGTFSVFTGYYQDRLLPSATAVWDVKSSSGAVLGQVTYRFSEVFSATVGIANFFGHPGFSRIPIRQALLGNNGGNFDQRVNYQGLSPIAERDELYVQLRYTF